MSTFLKEELGVAMSGVAGDVGNFKVFGSTDPNIFLYVTRQPRIAKGANGRHQLAVTQFRQQKEGTYKITGGSAIFTITSAPELSIQALEELREAWAAKAAAQGIAVPSGFRMVPLNTQKGQATVLINAMSGVPDEAHNDKDIGTPGGTNSFLIALTELGAQEWAQGIREKTAVPAGVKIKYEYLRMMPTMGAEVIVHGRRVFTHLSTQLKASLGGWWYGGSLNIEAEWEKMTRNGDVEVTFFGQLPPELEPIRTEMVTTFSNQAREQLFKSLFEPIEKVDPAQAGDTRGLFGGANFALKYKRIEEVTDLSLKLKFEGWTWLQASMDADCTTLFADLDPSYVTDVNTQLSVPASIVVDTDPQVSRVGVSWSASEGHGPEAPVFNSDGGNVEYVVTSMKPEQVLINCQAKISFVPPRWPIITQKLTDKIGDGGNQMVFKTSSLVGRHWIYMFIREGDRILGMTELPEDDYLVCNVSFKGPHLPTPIKDSAKITPLEPLEFSYPLDPQGRAGEATFAAFGVIGGKMVRAKAQKINMTEDAVFILASSDKVELVSETAILGESDNLARRLLDAKARPIINDESISTVREEAARKRESSDGSWPAGMGSNGQNGNGQNGTGGSNGHNGNGQKEGWLRGTLTEVVYGPNGPSLLVQTGDGTRYVRLRSEDLANRLDDGRKNLRIRMDADNLYAETVAVEL